AEGPFESFVVLEPERFRLHAAPTLGGREPAVEPFEIEHRYGDRRNPEVPVAGTEEEPVQRPRRMRAVRGDRDRFGPHAGWPLERYALRGGPGERGQKQQGRDGPVGKAGHGSSYSRKAENASVVTLSASTVKTPRRTRPSRRKSRRMKPLSAAAYRVPSVWCTWLTRP